LEGLVGEICGFLRKRLSWPTASGRRPSLQQLGLAFRYQSVPDLRLPS